MTKYILIVASIIMVGFGAYSLYETGSVVNYFQAAVYDRQIDDFDANVIISNLASSISVLLCIFVIRSKHLFRYLPIFAIALFLLNFSFINMVIFRISNFSDVFGVGLVLGIAGLTLTFMSGALITAGLITLMMIWDNNSVRISTSEP